MLEQQLLTGEMLRLCKGAEDRLDERNFIAALLLQVGQTAQLRAQAAPVRRERPQARPIRRSADRGPRVVARPSRVAPPCILNAPVAHTERGRRSDLDEVKVVVC